MKLLLELLGVVGWTLFTVALFIAICLLGALMTGEHHILWQQLTQLSIGDI
jgi:hypothetical protein